MARRRIPVALSAILVVILALSAIHPYERATWLMEVAPALVGLPLLAATYRRFPLTTLLYVLLFVHALILILGGLYTYARVPAGFWLQDLLSLDRNPYDRIGHLAQGFVPALLAREILLRGRHVAGRRMAALLALCIALAISASYELIEWGAAVALGQGADAFLGTQGDPWDTQADMLCALIGALVGLATLSRMQDRQIAQLDTGAMP